MGLPYMQACLPSFSIPNNLAVQAPFSYEALPPEDITFVPLKQTREFNARDLMQVSFREFCVSSCCVLLLRKSIIVLICLGLRPRSTETISVFAVLLGVRLKSEAICAHHTRLNGLPCRLGCSTQSLEPATYHQRQPESGKLHWQPNNGSRA